MICFLWLIVGGFVIWYLFIGLLCWALPEIEGVKKQKGFFKWLFFWLPLLTEQHKNIFLYRIKKVLDKRPEYWREELGGISIYISIDEWFFLNMRKSRIEHFYVIKEFGHHAVPYDYYPCQFCSCCFSFKVIDAIIEKRGKIV